MSVRVSAAVWAHSVATGAGRLVMLAIAERASHDGVAWPRREDIARKTRLAEPSVTRCVRELEALGELEVRSYLRGRTRLNIYRVLLPDLVADVDYARLDEYDVSPSEPFTESHLVTPSLADGVTPRSSRSNEALPPARAILIGVEPSTEPPVDQDRLRRSEAVVDGVRRAREPHSEDGGATPLFETDEHRRRRGAYGDHS